MSAAPVLPPPAKSKAARAVRPIKAGFMDMARAGPSRATASKPADSVIPRRVRRARSRSRARTSRDPIAPTGQPNSRAGSAGQGEKGGLEGILGFLLVAENSSADMQHHAAVPPDEQLEGGFIALLCEAPH